MLTKVKHHPALSYAELPAFMEKLRQVEGTATRALEFAILTAAQTEEVILAGPGRNQQDLFCMHAAFL